MLAPASVSAGVIVPGTYALHDHEDAALHKQFPTEVFYGLRLDQLDVTGLSALDAALTRTFSVERGGASVLLTWDGGTTATISGALSHNIDNVLWDVTYTLSGVTLVGTSGFEATMGSGLMVSQAHPADTLTLTGKQDGLGIAFRFLADGHRLMNDNMTPVARGWLMPPGSVDDWLTTATLIPEPGSIVLLSAGLAGLGGLGLRRRRQSRS
ncbi:MAG: PEP-CTERM sorting domain-containing protein [Planctomycetota bacterium]|nr:PEP-CTERM sorting domain-containing protein [Planctomycetota bacterium]